MPETDRNRGSPRLLFSAEEMADPNLERAITKAQKAEKKADSAQKKLKTHRRLVLSKSEQAEEVKSNAPHKQAEDSPLQTSTDDVLGTTEATERAAPANRAGASKAQVLVRGDRSAGIKPIGKPAGKQLLSSDTASDLPMTKEAAKAAVKKKTVRLHFEETQAKPLSKLNHPIERQVRTELRRQIASANEDDNVAVDAALKADDGVHSSLQMGNHAHHALKEHPYRKAAKAERALDKANLHYLEAKAKRDNPQFSSNPYSRWQQKRAIRKEYAAAKAGRSTTIHTRGAAQTAQRTTSQAGAAAKRVAEKFRQNPKVLLIGLLAGMLMVVMSSLQACTPLAQSVLESIVIGTYPATEDDVRAAERAYAAKEADLQYQLDHYAQLHPEYDEVTVDADEIWHDPYVLIAIISAYYDGQEWTVDSAYPVLEKYFALQYKLTESVTSQTRYNTETRTGTRLVTDPETGRTYTETYTYEVNVPYLYKTCAVTLENKNLSHMPVYSMSHHTMGMYALYMSTHGNMEGIFTGGHATPLRDPGLYDIPQETLDANPIFTKLMEEANKYVGYPYVWGGASPETSFDCSGFVSYVYTNSGVYSTGRLGATGLHGLCRNVTADQLKPGDLVFFEGTMGEDVGGITHVGIYVGNNHMIHCGSPLGYADLTESYWRQHFHSYGRVPY